ncbi:MAG: DUF3822 family protein [bacterium]
MSTTENIFISPTGAKALFFADESLVSKTAGTCDLYLLTEKDDIQLALKERRTGRILGFEVLPLNLKKDEGMKELMKNLSTQSKLLRNYEFLKVTAGIMTTEFTLVPEALFKPGDEELYFKKNFKVTPGNNIHFQYIPSFHLYSIFSIDKQLEIELNHLFQDPQLYHYSQALLCGLSLQKNTGSGKQMWLNVRKDKIDIVVSDNRKLHLLNSYSWNKNEDILYFALFVSEQLELNPEKFVLSITGEISESSSLYQLLGNYVRNITIPDAPVSLQNNVSGFDIPFYNHALLFNLVMCE